MHTITSAVFNILNTGCKCMLTLSGILMILNTGYKCIPLQVYLCTFIMGMKYIPYRVAINPPNAMTHLGFKTYALGINTNLKKRYNIYLKGTNFIPLFKGMWIIPLF